MADQSIQLYDLLGGNDSREFNATDSNERPSTAHTVPSDESLAVYDLNGTDRSVSEPIHTTDHETQDVGLSGASSRASIDTTRPSADPPILSSEDIGHLRPKNDAQVPRQDTNKSPYLDVVSWWIPELVSSALSVASFASIVIVLLVYDRCAVARLGMPSGLTLNGIVALLATIGRVCLCAPVCSALLQEMWLYLAKESKKRTPTSRLRDLELFFGASYGTVGSLQFLARLSSPKFVIPSNTLHPRSLAN